MRFRFLRVLPKLTCRTVAVSSIPFMVCYAWVKAAAVEMAFDSQETENEVHPLLHQRCLCGCKKMIMRLVGGDDDDCGMDLEESEESGDDGRSEYSEGDD